MKHRLIASLKKRSRNEIEEQNPVKFLLNINMEDILEITIPIVYLYTRNTKAKSKPTYFVEIISAIGHAIRNKARLKRDSALAAKAGAFILYSFEECGLLKVVLGSSRGKHAAYIVDVLNDDAIVKLWENTDIEKTEKLPSTTPYAPWTSVKHSTGISMIKTLNKLVLDAVTIETHPFLFNCLNKAQSTGWKVNKKVFDLVSWALRNRTEAFAEIWNMHNPEAKASKLREARAIIAIAKRFIDSTFYHLYYYDFRGRKYPATAYFHEQGSDLSKGLLLRKDSKKLGNSGYFWLLISIANNWAGDSGRPDGYKTDKIPLMERVRWCEDNEDIILSYADNPKLNQGWMKADKPWQFLAACMELYRLRMWQLKGDRPLDDYEFESHIECYIDGLLKSRL